MSTFPIYHVEDHYKCGKSIGEGNFGNVCLAKTNKHIEVIPLNSFAEYLSFEQGEAENAQNSPTYLKKGTVVAVKSFKKKEKDARNYLNYREYLFYNEVAGHQNIVQFYEMFIDDKELKCHMVTEAMQFDLNQFIQARLDQACKQHTDPIPFELQTIKSIASQIIDGLNHIHYHGYLHRDIKPENILMNITSDSLVIKLADFGLSRRVDFPDCFTSYVSTRWYRAPELLLERSSYSYGMDIWALGTVIAELANLTPMFPGANVADQLQQQLLVLGTPSTVSLGGPWREFHYLECARGWQHEFVNTPLPVTC